MAFLKKVLQTTIASILLFAVALPASFVFAASTSTNDSSSASPPIVPDLRELMASFKPNEMKAVAQRYQSDRTSLTRFYNVSIAPERCTRLRWFGEDWLAAVQRLDSAGLSEDARAERTRLLETIQRELRQVQEEARAQAEIAPLAPFSKIILDLDESRRRVDKVEAPRIAGVVDDLAKRINQARKHVEDHGAAAANAAATGTSAAQFLRAAESIKTLRTVLKAWFAFYNDYDPLFTWWLAQPYKEADKALEDYATALAGKCDTQSKSVDEGQGARPELQTPPMAPLQFAGKTAQVPDLKELIAAPQSRMRMVIERYRGNRGGRRGFGGGGGRPQSKEYYQEWLAGLQKLDFSSLTRDDQINYLLLKNRIESQLRRLDFRNEEDEDTGAFIPFQQMLEKLNDSQSPAEKLDAAKTKQFLKELNNELSDARKSATNQFEQDSVDLAIRAGHAARALGGMRNQLQDWHDKNSTDWQADESLEPLYKSADDGMESYAAYLREKSGGAARRDGSDIIGHALGQAALKVELDSEMISYTPEELLTIAEKEFAWCVAEMKRASREMGLGDDWRAALEKVKDVHVPVGEQPYLIHDLAWEAVEYLEKNDLVTIPEIARETWRMQMMSLQRQMVNPFFTGGETISVSYPLSEMSHDQKLQSMRGNNIPFARATVFHELIPGHELQGFTAARSHTERRAFGTSFYGEGWAVYWELLLYERGFHGSAENRMGALFWRLHRCARIIFSLNFHLEQWKPQQCIDYLVTQVGHERDNATAEVRRSFATSYGPLYQAGYLLGALQLRELHRELANTGMSDRAFHDAVLKEGSMPIAMLRATLMNQPLNPDFRPVWKFYGSTASEPDRRAKNDR